MNHREKGDQLEAPDALERATFFDFEEEPDPPLNRITNLIIGSAIAVHRALGPGFLEAVYESAMAIEMTKRGIRFVRQCRFDVQYEGHNVGEGRLDFLVEDEIVLELKAVESLQPIHKAVVFSYLKATGKRLAIVINFHSKLCKDEIRRYAF